MSLSLRRLIASGMLLLFAALWIAPVGAVCSHGATDAEAADARHQHGDAAQHSHGLTAAVPDQPVPESSCPMEQGQTSCTAQAPLPSAASLDPTAPPSGAALLPTVFSSPSETSRALIFHPPKA